MDFLSIMSFLGAAIVITAMPGPDNMFVLAQSIGKGKNAGIFTTFGLCTGLLVHITAVTIGISAVIYHSALAFTVVKYAGATYLLYLAYKSFKEKGSSLNPDAKDSLEYKSLYKKGIIMNLLNPKVSLFFLAFFPQFVHYENGNVSIQMLTYGILFLVQTLIIFSLISVFSAKVGYFLRTSSTISKKMNMIQGTLFTLIGLRIAFIEK